MTENKRDGGERVPLQGRRQEVTKFLLERDVIGLAVVLGVFLATAYCASELFIGGNESMAAPAGLGTLLLLLLVGK